MISLDKAIPAFQVQATSDKSLTQKDLLGKKTIIYFYPKDNTPGCTTEGQDFRDHINAFSDSNAQIFGVSRDSLRTHENFKAKHGFPFELISDPDETFCKLFDVIKLKKLYGKEYLGIDRSTFLIDEQGILRKEWRSVKVKGHVYDVLSSVQSL